MTEIRKKIIRVIGPPRSGTNLAKYLVETSTDIRGFFNYGWWKHSVPCPTMFGGVSNFEAIPTIIMFREPINQLASFYKLALRNTEVLKADNDINKFLTSPCFLSDSLGLVEYFHTTPVDYLVQFYHASLSWKDSNKYFIELSDLCNSPLIIEKLIYKLFGSTSIKSQPIIPTKYLARNADTNFSENVMFDDSTSIEIEKVKSAEYQNLIKPDNDQLKKINTIYDTLQKIKYY